MYQCKQNHNRNSCRFCLSSLDRVFKSLFELPVADSPFYYFIKDYYGKIISSAKKQKFSGFLIARLVKFPPSSMFGLNLKEQILIFATSFELGSPALFWREKRFTSDLYRVRQGPVEDKQQYFLLPNIQVQFMWRLRYYLQVREKQVFRSRQINLHPLPKSFYRFTKLNGLHYLNVLYSFFAEIFANASKVYGEDFLLFKEVLLFIDFLFVIQIAFQSNLCQEVSPALGTKNKKRKLEKLLKEYFFKFQHYNGTPHNLNQPSRYRHNGSFHRKSLRIDNDELRLAISSHNLSSHNRILTQNALFIHIFLHL